MRTNSRTFPAAEIVPESILAPIAFEEIFARRGPLDVDLGCGDGNFLVALAEQHPERNFVGIERLVGRVRSVSRKIGRRSLTNARIVRADILHAVQHHLPRGSVDVFYLMFPDPWPKRRHHVRRTFDEDLMRAVARALKDDGMIHVATDDADYFSAMQQVVAKVTTIFECENGATAELPTSTFEAKFRERGLPIHRFVLRKV